MSVQFTDNSIKVKAAMDEGAYQWLEESGFEIQAHTQRHTPVDTGQLKGSWTTEVDISKAEAMIGSPLENALWTELGTGEFALEGKGRKGGWRYQDDKGEWHFTTGKKPVRMLWNAFNDKKAGIKKRAEQIFKEKLGD